VRFKAASNLEAPVIIFCVVALGPCDNPPLKCALQRDLAATLGPEKYQIFVITFARFYVSQVKSFRRSAYYLMGVPVASPEHWRSSNVVRCAKPHEEMRT
jgi:hypothetical protein